MEDLSVKEHERINAVNATVAGKKLLERKARAVSTKLAYSTAVLYLSEFYSKPIDAIVEEYQKDVEANMYKATDKWEEIFKQFATWLEQNKGLGLASVSLYHAGAKALINVSVPRSMRLQAETPQAFSRTIAAITIEDLREIWDMCDQKERTYIAILKDSGISADDALRLNYSDIKGFEKEDYIRINVIREKEHVQYETFIGPNAVEALRAYTELRRRRGEQITAETPIFASDKKPYARLSSIAFSMVFFRIKKKTGKIISSHRLRKFFETYEALSVRHPIILKYWMGHKVRKGRDIEARYIIPPTPEQLKLYKESYKNIDLTKKYLEEERLKAIQDLKNSLSPEQLATMKRLEIQFRDAIRKRPEPEPERESEDCENGHCGETFEQIKESDLLAYLRNGWTIVHRLQSGDVILKK
jgi:integrase/recombinase XerD